MADTLLYLPPEQQRVQLQHRLRLAQQREQKSNAIAGVIRGYLDAHKEVDLEALRSLIQGVLAGL
jgi:hypothetical protein